MRSNESGMQEQAGRSQSGNPATGPSWQVYLARCADGSLYTGVATDVRRRLGEHNDGGGRAARYTRGRRPIVLVHVEAAGSRGAALRREREIRRLTRKAKEKLAASATRVEAQRS